MHLAFNVWDCEAVGKFHARAMQSLSKMNYNGSESFTGVEIEL